MGIPDKIQLLKRNEIDDPRWNNSVSTAAEVASGSLA